MMEISIRRKDFVNTHLLNDVMHVLSHYHHLIIGTITVILDHHVTINHLITSTFIAPWNYETVKAKSDVIN